MNTATKQRVSDGRSIVTRLVSRARRMNELVVLLVVLLLAVVLAVISPYFLTGQNISTLAVGLAADGIVAVGMTLALASGGFDLSVGSVMGLSAVVTAYIFSSGQPMWLAAVAGVGAAVVVGLVNGLLISRIGLNPFITTLGMMTIARGIVYVVTDGSSVPVTDPPAFFTWLGRGQILGVPTLVVVFIVVAIVGDYLLRNSSSLRRVFYVGSNAKAAALSGINVGAVQRRVYFIVAILAAVAGLLSLARFGVATPAMGTGAEMRVISAAVIGGASIAGGSGTVLGTVLGVVLLNLIQNALVLQNVSVNWQNTISGSILLIAVSIDTLSKKGSGPRLRPAPANRNAPRAADPNAPQTVAST